MVEPRRGDIWWARLAPPRSSGPGFPRPVLVVQSNPFNESRIQTVVVAAISSNFRLADAPGNVRLRPAESGLPKPSVVDVSQLRTVRRDYLHEQAGALPTRAMNRVAEGLRLVLGL